MPAKSDRQRKAMAVELKRRREGKKPQRFKSMSSSQLRDFARKTK